MGKVKYSIHITDTNVPIVTKEKKKTDYGEGVNNSGQFSTYLFALNIKLTSKVKS